MIINWPGLNEKKKSELIPTLLITDNWILLTNPLGTGNKFQLPFKESQKIARADKCSRHKEWWRPGQRRIGHTLHDHRSVDQHKRTDTRDNPDGHTESP